MKIAVGLACGISTDLKNKTIFKAVKEGNKILVKLLLGSGVDRSVVDKFGNTLLIEASYGGNKDVVQLLLDRGADIHAAGNDGETALFPACSNGHNEIVELLLAAGADVNAAEDRNGKTALMKGSWVGHNCSTAAVLGISRRVRQNNITSFGPLALLPIIDII